MTTHALLFVVLVVLSVPLYVLAARRLFGGKDELVESVAHRPTPGVVTLMRGEFAEHLRLKLMLWLGACVLPVLVEYRLLVLLLQ